MKLVWDKILNPFKGGKTSKSENRDDYLEKYAMITLRDVLEFDYKKSVALCIGIDRQFHHQYALQSLKNTVRDAEAMGKAFIDSLGLGDNEVKVRVPSSHPDDCKKSGVRTLFVESAKNVEENGIFIFYFAGHGYLVDGRCVLAPADFAGYDDLTTGISGDDLVEWLHEADCKAKQVLIILDCCYAGDLGKTMTSCNMRKLTPGVSVMCGCAAREKCMSIDALGHSVFAYFFLHYLEKNKHRGEFAIRQAMGEITELCFRFSSLLVSYNHKKGELRFCDMCPTLESDVGRDEIDFCRCELLVQLIQKDQPKAVPHSMIDNWLGTSTVKDSLRILYTKVPFSETLHKGILCSILYSAASIQYRCDRRRLEERNLFIYIAIKVLATVAFAYPEANTTISHLISGLQHYSQPILVGRDVDRCSLNELLDDMMMAVAKENGSDEVDSPVVLSRKEAPQLCRLPSWEPLD